METAEQTEWVVLDSGLETYCPTERFRSDDGGGAIPMVTAPTLVTLLLAALGDPDGCYMAFAIDASGACTIQDRAGAIGVLRPSGNGLYDLGRLSCTFRYRNDAVAPTPPAT